MTHSKSRVTKAGERLRAHRLGAAPLSRERYVAERAIVEAFRARHSDALKRVAANLRYYVRTAAATEPWSVAQRLKAMPTLLDKLVREPGMELARMHDIGGCRGILPTQDAVDDVIERLRTQRRWQLRDKLWDYVTTPKDDGYRAKHLVAIKDGVLIEIQLRTTAQQRWAELVERFDRTHSLNIKTGRANTDTKTLFAAISELLRLQEQGDLSEVEFRQRMSALASADES
ncbi:MAG: RelA/SpoT domain-containing protein [Conexibacter sp.]